MNTIIISQLRSGVYRRIASPGLCLILGLLSWSTWSQDRAASTAADSKSAAAPAKPSPAPAVTAGQDLFNGESLKGWKITDFAGHGEVRVISLKKALEALASGAAGPKDTAGSVIQMDMGAILTGIHFTNEFPTMNYEVSLEAMKLDGNDFFCGLTFPVKEDHCSLIVGGWGGGIVGISSLDGMDASENETTKFMSFPAGKWYTVRVRVTPGKIEAWLGEEKVADVKTAGRRISLRAGEIEMSKPFGVAAYQTTTALRNVRLVRLP